MNLKGRISSALPVVRAKSKKFLKFGHKQMRLFMLGAMMGVCAFADAQAANKGFASASSSIKSYAPAIKDLMYAIAGVIALVGAFNVYFKMQNGDQDVKKTIMMTVGGCVAMVAMATALPMFFNN